MKSDATLKNVFQRPPNLLLSRVFGREIVVKRILPTEFILVENLHPDVLFETVDGEIIHVELHGYRFEDFACRNLIHYGLIRRDFGRPPIQVAFWIGAKRVGVTSGLSDPPRLEYSYLVIDVRDLDGEFLLDSPDIREATFAILCKLTDPRAAIVHLGARIRLLTPEEQRVAIAHLLVLSGLRGLMEVVKEEISTMPLQIDIHENEFLDEIWHQGQDRGKDDEARENLLDLLDQRFGPITDVAILARIRTGGRADVKAWMRRVLDAPSVESIFR